MDEANTSEACSVEILNLQQGETVHYPIVYIFGKVSCKTSTCHESAYSIVCINTEKNTSDAWPVKASFFKIFVKAEPGVNTYALFHCSKRTLLKVRYQPSHNERHVKLIYLVCANSDGVIDAPNGQQNDASVAMQKVAFNACLLQTFLAENLNNHGFGRRTFKLDTEKHGYPEVHLFRSALDISEATDMNGDQLYQYFYKELKNSPLADNKTKFWAFMSCTRYCPPPPEEFCVGNIAQYVKAHTALGGGDMALFGTACLHTWASGLEDLIARFTDCSKIDRNVLFDDSCGRGTYWANYATTLGATIHELGHCLDLPHTPTGIMGRGFDDMHRFFLPHDTDHVPKFGDISPYIDDGAHWHRSSAVSLSVNRWLNEDCEEKENFFAPVVCSDDNVLGPVGSFLKDTSFWKRFDTLNWLADEDLSIYGFVFYFKDYLNAFQVLGWKSKNHRSSSEIISSPLVGDQNTNGLSVCRLELTEPNERIVRVIIRAGCWIDGLRIITTHKSSIWCGGQGGNMVSFDLADKTFCGLAATYGHYVGSLGVQVERSVKHVCSEVRDGTDLVHDLDWNYGPIGRDATHRGTFTQLFNSTLWLKSEGAEFAGFVVYAGNYINALQIVGRRSGSEKGSLESIQSPVIGSLDHEHVKCYTFLLDNAEEVVRRIEFRAGSLIDGMRVVTNYKSSIWFGGYKGKLRKFNFTNDRRMKGLQLTAESFITSVSIDVERTVIARERERIVTPALRIISNTEIKLLEAQDESGDVYFFKEFEGRREMKMPKDWVLQGLSNCALRVVNAEGVSTRVFISEED